MTNHPPAACGTIPTMTPSLVPILNAVAIILIIIGLAAFLASLIPATTQRIPRLFPGSVTILCIGLVLGVVLFVLESAY